MCIKQLKDMSNKEDETVRAVKGNIVMIARKEDLKLLDVDCLELFGDGTFKYSPRFFNQMYTFFCYKEWLLFASSPLPLSKQNQGYLQENV